MLSDKNVRAGYIIALSERYYKLINSLKLKNVKLTKASVQHFLEAKEVLS